MAFAFSSHQTSAPEHVFQVLGNRIRLRILRALEGRELGVGELAEALRLTQSSASKHLALLSEAGLVKLRREGTWTFCQRSHPPATLERALREALRSIAEAEQDEAAVSAVLQARRERSARFFSAVGTRWDEIRAEYGGLEPVLHALAGLVPRMEVVLDLGTGAGHLLPLLRELAHHVIALDSEPAMLSRAVQGGFAVEDAQTSAQALRGATAPDGGEPLLFVRGDAQALPLPNGAVDAVFASQLLRHVPHPPRVLAEVARVLTRTGHCVVIDLCEHHAEWLRDERGHQWLGFSRESLAGWLQEAGLELLAYQRVASAGSDAAGRPIPDAFVAHARRAASPSPVRPGEPGVPSHPIPPGVGSQPAAGSNATSQPRAKPHRGN